MERKTMTPHDGPTCRACELLGRKPNSVRAFRSNADAPPYESYLVDSQVVLLIADQGRTASWDLGQDPRRCPRSVGRGSPVPVVHYTHNRVSANLATATRADT